MSKRENIRTKEIKNLVLMIIVTAVVGLLTLVIYITKDNNKSINYNEKSNIDYKVFLKDNEFYKEKFINKDKGYIASLIKSISSDFKYDVAFSENVEYKYSYRISAEVDVKDEKNDSNIYHFTEDLFTKNITTTSGDLNIDKEVNINYDEYNNKISRFKEIYDLKNTEAKLNVNLYVHIQDIYASDSTVLNEKKVSSLTIPLTENTVSIDINNESIANNNKTIEITEESSYGWILVVSIFFLLISAIYIVYLVLYSIRTRTAQMIYVKEIKSIMNNYDSYIQKISGSYDIGASQVLKIESFNDMLEIRDTLKQPILMLENESKDGTFFIIPATNSIIYTYALRVVDIKAKMEGKEVPTYDITEIPHADFMKKKKYTDKYIKEQLTMTTSMPQVDERNVIKGSKSKEDLYDQLEKTISFDLKEIKKAKKELEMKEKELEKRAKEKKSSKK